MQNHIAKVIHNKPCTWYNSCSENLKKKCKEFPEFLRQISSLEEFIFSAFVSSHLANLLKNVTQPSQVFYKEIAWILRTTIFRTTS